MDTTIHLMHSMRTVSSVTLTQQKQDQSLRGLAELPMAALSKTALMHPSITQHIFPQVSLETASQHSLTWV